MSGAGGLSGPALITGGAGFIGCNVADRLLAQGQPVRVFDNLSRGSVEKNLEWLKRRHGALLDVRVGDVRDRGAVREAVAGASSVFHFAAQVAVTTSLEDPVTDFDVNARGTLHVLEALRERGEPVPLLFTSTNKVYGGLERVEFVEQGGRYEPSDELMREHGVSEAQPLDFHSPYGCSKGSADQYVIDYARAFGVRAVVFRMSCIYGPRQFGTEDQGWVAHFLIRALKGEAINVYGDGKQVRDVLFVDDLVDAMLAARDRVDALRGRAFNIGGGPRNTLSLLELLSKIGTLHRAKPEVTFGGWRTGDHRYYVSDVRAFGREGGWAPRVSVDEGVERLYRWLSGQHAEEAGRPGPQTAGAP